MSRQTEYEYGFNTEELLRSIDECDGISLYIPRLLLKGLPSLPGTLKTLDCADVCNDRDTPEDSHIYSAVFTFQRFDCSNNDVNTSSAPYDMKWFFLQYKKTPRTFCNCPDAFEFKGYTDQVIWCIDEKNDDSTLPPMMTISHKQTCPKLTETFQNITQTFDEIYGPKWALWRKERKKLMV